MSKAKVKLANWLRNVADRIESRVVRCDIGTGKDYTVIAIGASISHEAREKLSRELSKSINPERAAREAMEAAKIHLANDLCEALRENGFIEYSEDEYNLVATFKVTKQ